MINYPRSDKTGAGRFVPSWKLVLGLMLSGIVLAAGAFALAVFLIPVPDQNDVALAETTKVTYADGKNVIGRVGDVRRTSIPLSEVPEHVQYAVLAAEDRDFYDHGGFSIQGITRAFVNNISGGDKQGGSTITQQYVKNAYLTQEQTWTRKLRELVLSVKLETVESKDQILEDYLNTIYFGRGAYGIEAASEAYFGKKTAKLTLEEGAALAAVIQSPGNFEPSLYPDELQARWNYVLEGMLSEGWITQQEYQNAEFPKFKKLKNKNQYAGQNGYIIEAVRREMVEMGWTEAELNQGGLTIVTTIDRKAQSSAVTAVETAGPQYDDQRVRIGLAAVRPVTGEIAAIYGGKNYLDNQLDNALQARAQAGSTFKAYTLAAALEEDFGLDSTWNGNSPATVQGYTLQNFANASYGTVSLLQATTKSINTAYVDAEATVGVKESIDAAERLGLPADTPGIEPNLTFVLGSASPRAIDMAASFSTFAGRGTAATPTIIRKIMFNTGEEAYRIDPDRGRRVFDPQTMDLTNYALQTVVTSGTATRASWTGRPAAGKTGTTDDSTAAWFVGYTPQMSAAVMMTKSDKKGNPVSLNGTGGVGNVTGGSFPTAIWATFIEAALADEPQEDFVAPGELPSPSAEPSESESPSEEPSPTESPTTEPTQPPTQQPTQQPTLPPTPTPPDPGPQGGSPQPTPEVQEVPQGREAESVEPVPTG